IEDVLDEQRHALFYDEYETGVPGEVVIYSDRIEVQSFVYQDGFTQQLPRGGEYQGRGTGCWVYLISKRDHFDKGRGGHWYDFPVLYAVENSTN
ncbi:MAG: hypothetical protein WBB01_06465, partial [Phormidesmis sp.]